MMLTILAVFGALTCIFTLVGAGAVGLSFLFTALVPMIGTVIAFILVMVIALLMIAIIIVVGVEIMD